MHCLYITLYLYNPSAKLIMLCCSDCFKYYSNNPRYEVYEVERTRSESDCVCGPEEEFYGESIYTPCAFCEKNSACPSHLRSIGLKEIPTPEDLIRWQNKIKNINEEIECLPDIGIKYQTALTNFTKNVCSQTNI